MPPIVTLPVTSKLPFTLTFEFKLISPLAAAIFASNVNVSTVLPLMRQSPVSIFEPSTNVVSLPVVNDTPVVVSI